MAEARAAVIVIDQSSKRGLFRSTHDGYELTILVPNLKSLVRILKSIWANIKNSILYSFWPAPPLVLTLVVGVVSWIVVVAEKQSWMREGW